MDGTSRHPEALKNHLNRDFQVPAKVQAVLAARIDRLPPDDKSLLQTAAVLRKDVPFTLLLAVANRPDDHVRQAIALLQPTFAI